MTQGKKFKQRVRARMEADGVTYSEALRRIRAEDAKKPSATPAPEQPERTRS